jgi:LCP family protein required for cell wall assembly
MKYRSFNYSQINTKPARKVKRRQGKAARRQNTTKSGWGRPISIIVSLVVILFGAKLLLSPVVSVIASMVRESSATISYMLNREGLAKQDGVTNVLVLGVDERYQGGVSLTDTIMVLSYNHENKSLSLVSLPRDLWVRIPAFDSVNSYFTKINSVYTVGEDYGYPTDEVTGLGGGSGLLATVIENHIGLPIHYYTQFNFEGFKDLIDSVGGLDIYVEQSFTDYEYPIDGYENAPLEARWETLNFSQGWQHMDGETALKYARSRHAFGPEGSDFARAKRQQKVVLALKDKIMSNETIFNLDRMRNIYLTLTNKFDSNVSVTELPTFYNLVRSQKDLTEVQTIVLDNSGDEEGLLYVPDPNNYGGAFVLLPKGGWGVIEDYLSNLLYAHSSN